LQDLKETWVFEEIADLQETEAKMEFAVLEDLKELEVLRGMTVT
jgi:hypothetical protein